jgi:murein DD-endopeptidase MepM/ murein hydrolase activator NlpD
LPTKEREGESIFTMKTILSLIRKAFSSVTIMVIPHNSLRTLNLKVSAAVLLATILLAAIGGAYLLGLAIKGLEYKAQHHAMAEKVKFYSDQFYQWSSTVRALKTAEAEFRKLFSLESREEVLENVEASSIGSLEVPDLVLELKKTIETVDGIKDYLRIQKDIYAATPMGYPASGDITSRFGKRLDPVTGEIAFHSGIDITCSLGTPIHATADGVVSHSGWTEKSGYVVVLEHGCGFSTVYAHNKSNTVKLGQKVKRGEVIGYVGSTGKSTGPHVHYEVWKDRKSVDAQQYLQRRA